MILGRRKRADSAPEPAPAAAQARPDSTDSGEAGHTWRPWVLLDEPGDTAQEMSAWPRLGEQFPQVVGFSRFGQVALGDPDRQRFGIFDPDGGALGTFADIPDIPTFTASVLGHPDLTARFMPDDLVRDVVGRLGPVEGSTVYIPAPYRFMGGSGAADTYSTGDVWVYVHLTGQFMNGPAPG